ncbi:hypothetical protein GGH14_002265, partial [Coemansia sp. RSA 370]
MTAPGSAADHGLSDCVQCQRVTRGTVADQHLIDTRALYSCTRTNSWSIAKEDSWQLFVTFLRELGLKPGLGWQSACPAFPSRVTIVAASVFDVSLKHWRKTLGDGNLAITDTGRMLTVLQLIAWLGSSSTNLCVLLHHGIALCICDLLTALRSNRTDVFNYTASTIPQTSRDGLLRADVRSYPWQQIAQPGTVDKAAVFEYERHISAIDALYVVFQHAMVICGRLFDPVGQFDKFLLHGTSAETSVDYNTDSAQGDAVRILSEIMLIWQQLETLPSRSYYSPAVLALCSATGGLVASGLVDSRMLRKLGVTTTISKTLAWLDIDEAYVAWRLLTFIQERFPEPLLWSVETQTAIDRLWQATALRPTEPLQNYAFFKIYETPEDAYGKISDTNRVSLEALFPAAHNSSATDRYPDLCQKVELGGQTSGIGVDPVGIDSFLDAVDDPFSETRLRRAIDAVVTGLSQHAQSQVIPNVVLQSVMPIHRALLSITQAASSNNCTIDDAYAKDIFVFEYARLLWRLWTLPLQYATKRAVFRTIGADVWDRVLSLVLMTTEHTDCITPQHAPKCAQQLAAVAGWLVANSVPGGPNNSPILDPPVYKLLFSRLTESLDVSGSLSLRPAYAAAQGLALICWADIQWFRLLLHETQSVSYMLTAVWQLRSEGLQLPSAESTEALGQSVGNLSVVSLPDESMYDISSSRGACIEPNWSEQLLCMTMFMLHSVITKSWPEHNKTSHSILRIAWQTAHAEVQQSTAALDAPACTGVLRDLFQSGSPAVVGFATELTTELLRWLLICAYGGADMDGMGGDARSRVEAARGWSQFAVHHIAPAEIGTASSLREHAEFLARYRSCLGEAVLAIGTQQSGATINALVIGDGALDDLLALVQLAATLDVGPNAASSSLSLSFGSASEMLSDHGDRDMDACLGVLICEALKLLAFLIHGSTTYTARFTRVGGYSIVNTCVTNISRRSPTASAAMCEGMLALLSGSIDPVSCRTWKALRIDRDWLPTMTTLYSQLPLVECIGALRFIAHWCEESRHARWWCAQSTFARQSIERLQTLLAEVSCAFAQPEDRQACVVAYTRYLGSMLAAVMGMSACAADLKLLLRTMVSAIGSGNISSAALEAGEAAKYTLLVRQTLSLALIRCARESPGHSYFDFGGGPGALHAPYFRRIPEQGFTFTAWICPDQAAHLGEHHLLPVNPYDPISSVPSPGPGGHSQSAVALSLLLGKDSTLEVEVGTLIHLATGNSDSVLFAYNHLSEGLKLCITADGSQNTVHCADKLVSPGKWHSLSLCYAPAKRGWSPFAASNVHVYVDGAHVYKGSLPFIDHSAYRSCFVGGLLVDESPGAVSIDGGHDSSSDQRIQNPFTGRIAGIRMFDGLLRTSEIELLHHLGPAHASQLRKHQGLDLSVCASTLMQSLDQPLAASLATSVTKDIAGLFANGELGSRLILSLDAKATTGSTCLDLSPIGVCQAIVCENARYSNAAAAATASASNQTAVSLCPPHDANKPQDNSEDRLRMEEASQPWQMCGNVLAASTTTIHQLLSSIGGIESVLVLLYHLDWIGSAMPLARVGPLGSEERAFDQRMLERMPLPSFFYLLRDLVCGDPCMLGGIHALNMVSLIARIIQKQPDLASHLTMATLRAIQGFQTALDAQGGCLPSVYADTSQFWSQVQRELVFNLRIWRRATAECQLLYLKEMQHLLCLGRIGDEQGKRCNASAGICGKKSGDGSLGVRWILYTLFNYYPYDTSQHTSQQHQQLQRARQRARSLSARPTTPATSGPGHTNTDNAVFGTKSNTVPPVSSLETPPVSAENDYNIDVEIPESDVPGFPPLLRTETKQLRRVLLRTLELFLTTSNDQLLTDSLAAQLPPATRTDVTHLVRHLLFTCNRDTEHTRELLQLLFRCLADGSPNANSLASKLLSAGGLDVLTHIIECDDDSMAAEAINIVVLLLAMSAATREHESTASRITNSLRGRVPVVVDTGRISRMLALIRTKKALTPALYRSLLLLTLRDHAALLASINIDSVPNEPAKSPPMRRVKHIRNLSIPQSLSSSVYLADDAAADAQESYVAPLPSRLVQDAAACSAILELACAPGTDPSVRVVVLRDICRLLEDEPANYERLGTPYLSLLSHLVSVVVICGYISEDSGDEASKSEGDAEYFKPGASLPRLLDVYAKAMGHLELVPHTTLDYHMQTLAVGHIRARKAWVERRMDQLRRSTISSDAGGGEDVLLVQAQTELMLRTQEWSQAALHLIQILVLHFFSVRSDYASKVHRIVVALWALTPTGSVPLAVQLISLILSQAHDQLQAASDMRQPQTSEWPLPHNLYMFALHALDMLFNYRQFQEYVAYHHEQLKALSASASATVNIPSDERDGVYHSQHSPWDDMPELTRDLIEFMLELNRFSAYLRGPMCAHVLRLAVSGIRSMHLQRVKDSLHYLIRLLEQHSAQVDSTMASSSAPIGCVCSGNCTISQHTFAVLGYVHEAFMFAREQAGAETPRVYQHSEASSTSSCSDRVHAWESIGQQYMVIFQCYRAHISSTCPQLRATTIFSGSDKVSLDWDQFVNFANSSEWQDLYRMQFMPAMRTMEEEEMRQASSSQSGFAAILRELLVHSHKAESRQVRETRSAQTAVASSTLPIEADEASCVKAEELSSSDGRWLSLWRQRLQALSAPRGPWRPMHRAPQPVPTGGQQWILDMTENSQRMRRRLLKNASYEDHQVAANRRDRTGSRQRGKSEDRRQRSARNESLSDDENVPHLSLSVPGADHAEGHGLDGDEEWSMITPEDLSVMTAASDPSATHFSIPGERIALLGCVYGRIELTQSLLRFVVERDSSGRACIRGSDTVPSSATTKTSGDTTRQTANTDDMPRVMYAELSRDALWQLSDIQQIHFRRYMMRGSALEIFFRDRTSVLLNISNKKALMQLAWKLTSLPAANHQLALSDLRPPPVLMRRLGLTERWQRGELSNFDYLMSLNTVAGRSYNDLSQYPVFPWVIRDYTSKWLDLQNPKTYRDLSRPMGALSEKRLRQFIERYESFEDPTGRIK